MKIKVTQEDIDKGKRNTCTLCPVALAAKRQFPKGDPYVLGTGVAIMYKHPKVKRIYFHMSSNGSEFIKDFDGYIPVNPIEIELTEDPKRWYP